MKKIALLLAVTMVLSFCSCGSESDTSNIKVPILKTNSIKYSTAKSEVKDITQTLVGKGVFDYPYSQTVKFSTSGQIKKVKVESPADVKKGQVLCTLYTDDLEEQIETEKIRLAQSQKTYDKLKSTSNSSQLQLAEYDLKLEKLKYEHLVSSKKQYNVYAPCDGEFTFASDQNKDNGDGNKTELNVNTMVTGGQNFGKVKDLSKQELCVSVYDKALENVNFGTSVSLSQGTVKASGKVTDIISNENGEYSTFVYVITPDGANKDKLDSGDVQVTFNVYSRLKTVVVPQKAVKTISNKNYVNLLIDNVKVQQDVELGIKDSENVEILSGLSGGQTVILN